MGIVFNINPSGMAGLGATIASLIRNCSDPGALEFYFLASKLELRHKHDIRRLLSEEGASDKAVIIDYDAPKHFGHLRPLLNDFTTYGKSLIPEVVNETTVLYLDADLVINTDVLTLEQIDDQPAPISAVSQTTIRSTYDGPSLRRHFNMDWDTPYFNAGVMLFNIPEYFRQSFRQRWHEASNRCPQHLFSADQTVFNAMCNGSFGRLADRFNVPWPPNRSKREVPVADSIIHFVGAPKPWALSGRYIHPGYGLWRRHTPEFWYNKYCGLSSRAIRQEWRGRRSLLRHLMARNGRPGVVRTGGKL